jgi:GPH family glycoside/pentoside/hexuronide:cation symporter
MTDGAQTSVQPLPLSQVVAYGFLGLPLAFAGLPLYIHIPDFYTRELGLSLASAGVILMILRLFEAVQDPVIGYISDRSAHIQRLVMGVGLAGLLIGMGALFNGPPSFIPVAYWFAGSVALTAMSLSMCSINLVMIGSLWRQDAAARRRISALREGLSLGGMLLASVLPAILILSSPKAEAFEIFYVIFAVLLMLASWAFIRFYKNLPDDHSIKVKNSHHISIRIPLDFFKNNKAFLGTCFLTHIAASFPAVLFLYFVSDYLGAGDKAGIFLFLYFISGACFMPLWLKMANTFSNERAWLISMIIAISAFVVAFSLAPGQLIPFAIICIFSGAALGADLALPPVMMAERLERQNGHAYATQAYAVLNLLPKIALALATGGAFLLLSHFEFKPSQENTATTLWMLAALYALVPCVLKALSALLVFNLSKESKNEIQKRSVTHGYNNGA